MKVYTNVLPCGGCELNTEFDAIRWRGKGCSHDPQCFSPGEAFLCIPVPTVAHQRVGAVGRQDRNVDRGRVVRDAESAVLRFVLRMVEPDDARDRTGDHAEGVLKHDIVHRTAQPVHRN
uniref:Uncharacterized protein n=1 Tax=Anopheles atroparvus TaxID=41427 RepID=A0AAG5CYT0_ANOAO